MGWVARQPEGGKVKEGGRKRWKTESEWGGWVAGWEGETVTERLPVKRFYKGKVGDSKYTELDWDAVEAAKTVSLLMV